jgi:adenine-specific DNA-methyltransferase
MIRSELDVLLDKIEDSALRADLRSQIDRLKQRRSFGLVFEQHIPERVRLPQHPIRVASQVVSRDGHDSPTFEVVAIEDGMATLVPVRDGDGAYVQRGEHAIGGHEGAPLDSLVVISDFGEPVLPGFRYLGSVERGGDKPFHVVINGENHHALEALRFTHAGRVDCIYIDPPYNSGARDWKYNNDYVDDSDAYRHSKWLAFIERRLKLASELLNPYQSVLIVTIDEKEYLRLGMLLEQTFPQARITMVTSSVIPQAPLERAHSREPRSTSSLFSRA